MQNEPRGHEGHGVFARSARWKVGLETPLTGRYGKETWLVFAPPRWYEVLTWVCMAFGAWAFLSIFVSWLQFGPGSILPSFVRIWVGPLVFVGGFWGQLSSERMTINLRNRTYRRREGQGLFKRNTAGSLGEIDAVVVLAEPYQVNPGMVVYRTVLYWKGHKEPPIIVEQAYVQIGVGSPLNSGAGVILRKSAEYARRMSIPFYDNTHFSSPAPLRPV